MSEQAYLAARVQKSYVGGKWVPISQIPKHELKAMRAQGRFGQKHLKDVDDFQNAVRGQLARQAVDLRSSAPNAGTERNMFTGKKMQRTGNTSIQHNMLGPHIAFKRTPTDTHAYRPADKESMRMVKPTAVIQHWGGARFRTGKAGIEAHEHAHGMARRAGPTVFSSRSQRMMDANKDEVSRLAAGRQGIREQMSFGLKLGNSLKRQALTEEARADVMASRRLGRTMVSGHVKDTGRAKDYISDRRKIERGMGMKETKRHQIVYPVAPKHVAAGVGTAGVGGLAYTDWQKQKKAKARR